MFTGNPKGFNHFYDLYNTEYTDKDFKSFHFTTYDNPFIPVDEIEKAKEQETKERFEQEYLALFRKSEGLAIKEFSREAHLFDYEITGYSDFLAGIDFGYTNPTAIPSVCLKDGSFYVTRELYRTGMTDDEVGDYTASQRFNKVYPDPENAAAIEVLKRKGVNVREVTKGPGSIEHGLNVIRELFKQNRLFIHKSCINLISELEMYSYADSSPLRNDNENPQDKYNHAIDALRYVVSTHTMNKPFIKRPFHDKTIEIWQGR